MSILEVVALAVVLVFCLMVAGLVVLAEVVAVCWILAQLGYTFSGITLLVPFCIVILIDAVFGNCKRS